MIFILDPDSLLFPDPQLAEADGFLAIGGDVSPERLRAAYSSGIFPWSAFEGERELYWWAPRPRFVLRPDEVHISHSMRQLRHSGRYRVTFNTAFARVVDGCRTAQDRHRQQGAWLSEPLMASFCQLHDEGLAESVEPNAWQPRATASSTASCPPITSVRWEPARWTTKNTANICRRTNITSIAAPVEAPHATFYGLFHNPSELPHR